MQKYAFVLWLVEGVVYYYLFYFRLSQPSAGVIYCIITLILHYVDRFVGNHASCHCISHQVGWLQSTPLLPVANSQKIFPFFKRERSLLIKKTRLKSNSKMNENIKKIQSTTIVCLNPI